LSSYASLNPIFYAPSSSYYTSYTCTLTVNDGRGGSASDSVNITVRGSGTYNNQPYVDAGYNRDVQAGQSIYLNATASDPDGDYLTYSWSCTGGSLSSYASLNPIFYAPSSSYYTSYTCTLTVNDGRGGSASDSVNIRIGTGYYGQNPSVSTNLASNTTNVSARLNGYLAEDGGENTSVRFNWGRGSYLNYYTPWIDYKRSGSYFYSDIYDLEKGKTYQFRAEARNGRGTVYGSTLKFITKPDAPLNFDARLLNDYQVQLSWNNALGSCNTSITRKTSGYPSSVSDGTLVYYGNDTSFIDADVFPGNTYYYRAWSIACDQGLYSVSDSLYAKDYVVIAKTVTPTVIVRQPTVIVQKTINLMVDVVGRNLTQNESACPTEASWKDSITAQPGEEIEVKITVSALNGNAENVILTNVLPVKIDEVYDLKIEEQTIYGDANGSFILGSILQGKSKTVIFKARLNKEDSFAYGATDLANSVEVNGKNIETARDALNIRVSKGIGEEAMGGLSGFVGRNWKVFYLFLGLFLGLVFFLLAYFFFQEQEKRKTAKKEDIVLEKSKYFHLQ
ncbi:MAG: PKD domain-containing protein, partial [Candidatus Pacebacteria bacterium]|nr:PKD domain-containing protein [Candidatus Paceibacterota bacterium]